MIPSHYRDSKVTNVYANYLNALTILDKYGIIPVGYHESVGSTFKTVILLPLKDVAVCQLFEITCSKLTP